MQFLGKLYSSCFYRYLLVAWMPLSKAVEFIKLLIDSKQLKIYNKILQITGRYSLVPRSANVRQILSMELRYKRLNPTRLDNLIITSVITDFLFLSTPL
jgi:hypothetical protein